MQAYAIGLLLLRIGKHVTQLSVATARVTSQRVLMQRAVARAIVSPQGIAGAAFSAGVMGVVKDHQRLGITSSRVLLPPLLPFEGDPLGELRSSFTLALALVLGLAAALIATWSNLRYKEQREAGLLAANSTLVATAWEKHAAALGRLDWAAVATMYHPEAVLVVSVLGEAGSNDSSRTVVCGDECGVHGLIEWLQAARSELDPAFGGDPSLFTEIEKATSIHHGISTYNIRSVGESNTDGCSSPKVHSNGSQQERVVVEVNETNRTVFKLWRSAEFTGCDLYFYSPPNHKNSGDHSLVVYQKSTVKKLQSDESQNDFPEHRIASSSSNPASSSASRCSGLDDMSPSHDEILINSFDSGVDEVGDLSFAGGSVYSEDGHHVLRSNGWSRVQDEGSDSEGGETDEAIKGHVSAQNGSYRPAPESPERVRRATTVAVESARRQGARGYSVDSVLFSSTSTITGSSINNVYDAPAGTSGREGGYLGVTAAAAAVFRRLSPAEERSERVADAVGRSVFKAATEDAADKLWSHLRSIVFGPRGLKWARSVFVSFDHSHSGRLGTLQFEDVLVSLGAADQRATVPAAVLAEIMAAVHAGSRPRSPSKKYRGSSSSGVAEISYDELIQCLRMWGPQPFKARRRERWDAIRLSSPTTTASAITARHTTDDTRSSRPEVNLPARIEPGMRFESPSRPGDIKGVKRMLPTLQKMGAPPELAKAWNPRPAASPPTPPPTLVDNSVDDFEVGDRNEIYNDEAIKNSLNKNIQDEVRAQKGSEEKSGGLNHKKVATGGKTRTELSMSGQFAVNAQLAQSTSSTLHSPASAADLVTSTPKAIPALRSPYALLPSMAALMASPSPTLPNDSDVDVGTFAPQAQSSRSSAGGALRVHSLNSHDDDAVSAVEVRRKMHMPSTVTAQSPGDIPLPVTRNVIENTPMKVALKEPDQPSAKDRYIAAATTATVSTPVSPGPSPKRQPHIRSLNGRGVGAAAVGAAEVTPTKTRARLMPMTAATRRTNVTTTMRSSNSEMVPTMTTAMQEEAAFMSPTSPASKWSTPPSVRECAAADWRAMEAERDRAHRTHNSSYDSSRWAPSPQPLSTDTPPHGQQEPQQERHRQQKRTNSEPRQIEMARAKSPFARRSLHREAADANWRGLEALVDQTRYHLGVGFDDDDVVDTSNRSGAEGLTLKVS